MKKKGTARMTDGRRGGNWAISYETEGIPMKGQTKTAPSILSKNRKS